MSRPARRRCRGFALALSFAPLAPLGAAAEEAAPAAEVLKLFAEERAVVASLEPEPLRETPVITSIITADQIRRMGARTLNEVLLTVPGFSRIQDHNEYFSALRGVYGSSQQKILVLRDGHRLNSRSYSAANFGAGIALNNVKRVEVMRGPASALYGDVATTGVVNLVTKEGGEIGGTEAGVGVGDFGAVKLEFLHGRDLGRERAVVFHASAYRTAGEKRAVGADGDYAPAPEAGTVVVDRFSGLWPAHDIGVKYRVENLAFSASRRYETYTHPRGSAGGYGQLIDHDSFRDFNGHPLGTSFISNHLELKYSPRVGETELTLRPYFDTFETLGIEPTRRAGEAGAAPGSPKSLVVGWKDRGMGLQALAARPYASRGGESRALLGAQVERLDVYGSFQLASPVTAGGAWTRPDTETLPSGRETTYALFGQAKHRLHEAWVLNAGLRYDYKLRARYAQVVDRLSPRAALVFLPARDLSLRVSYGRSFSDPPYFYRYNTLGGAAGYQGSDQLRPETLDSTQFGAEWTAPWRLTHRVNVFVNDYRNVYFRDSDGLYKNTGALHTRGLEAELALRRANLDARANYTFLYAESNSVGYQVQDNGIANVPSHMGNLAVDYAPLRPAPGTLGQGLWLHGGQRVVGSQLAPIGVSQPATNPADFAGRNRTHVSAAHAVTDLGVSLEDVASARLGADTLTFRFHVYNLFDVRYRQGGSVNLPYEQPGRWFLAQVGYRWY